MFLRNHCNLQLLLMAFNLSFKPGYIHDDKNNTKSVMTRSKDTNRRQLWILTPNTSLVENSFSFQLRKSWNSLPTSAHCCSSRKELNKFLLDLLDHEELLE